MQTSITTWLKKSAAVKQSTAPVRGTEQSPLETQPAPLLLSNNQHDPTTPTSPPRQQQQPPPPTLTLTVQPPHLPFANPEPPLVKNITLVPCSTTTLSSFQRLNALLLPIPYPQQFYKEILSDPVAADLTLLALWHDDPDSAATAGAGRVVGGIRCRILPDPAAAQDKILYISTLGVLGPFRSFGVATHLLHAVVAKGIRRYGVNAVGAHVWEASAEAREWYRKRGFRETHKEEAYYRRLKPQGAFVLRREIGPRDLLDFGRG